MESICQALNSCNSTAVNTDQDSSSNSIQALEMLLDESPDLLQESDCMGDLPLHAACSLRYGTTPLLHTVPVLKVMTERNPAALWTPNAHGMIPLHIACWFRRRDAIAWLVERFPAALEMEDDSGYRPLSFLLAKIVIGNLAWEENKALVEYLLTKSPDSLWHVDKLGILPLQHFNARGIPGNALQLLELYCEVTANQGGLKKSVTKDGKTPLHVAIQSNSKLSIVQGIYKRCPGALQMPDRFHGRLPLHSIMAETDFSQINFTNVQQKLKWLLQTITTLDPYPLTQQDNGGKTALHLLLENASLTNTVNSHQDVNHMNADDEYNNMQSRYYGMMSLKKLHAQQERLVQVKTLVQMLLDTSTKPCSMADKQGNVPLHLVVMHHSTGTSAPELLPWILHADPGAIDKCNATHQTPLQIALQQHPTVSLNAFYSLIQEGPYGILNEYPMQESITVT